MLDHFYTEIPDLRYIWPCLSAVYLSILTASGSTVWAAEDISLADVVRAADQLSPARSMDAAIQREAIARQQQANSLFIEDPILTLSHDTDQVDGDDGYREWEAGVEIPLWLPGQKDDRQRQVKALFGEADATRLARQLEVAGEVRERLWELLIATEELRQAEAAYLSNSKLEQLIRRRVEAGELARAELNLARKDSLAREAEVELARSEYELTVAHYQRYVGDIPLPDDYVETLQASEQLDDEHPQLMLARSQVGFDRATRDRVRNEGVNTPSLYLGMLRTRDNSQVDYDNRLSVAVSVPLGLDSHKSTQQAAAERQLTEAEVNLAMLRKELHESLHHREAEYLSIKRQVELAIRQRGLADEGERLANRAFEMGEYDLFKLLAIREQTLQARRTEAVGQLELGRAIARYNQAAGVIPQ
jgi:outer membrane protein TolC